MIFSDTIYAPFIEKLKKIYTDMDNAYNKAANHYGFNCRGCKDNCCLTRFYHHTYLEYFYIYQGYCKLEDKVQANAKSMALEICEKAKKADKENKKLRIMCPLNSEELCLIYEYRPMICRLHGLAHELHRPGQDIIYSPGCQEFTDQTTGKDYLKFDRTPFYIEMARLESELKNAANISKKIKMTISEMIETF